MLAVPATPINAANLYLDPTADCVTVLSGSSEQLVFAAAYAFGYNNAVHDTIRPIPQQRVQQVLELLKKRCLADPGLSFHETLVAMIGKPADESGRARTDPSTALQAEGRALLEEFLDPGADRAALTWRLKPRAQDVRALYREPLASALIARYDRLFKPGTVIGGKPGQTELQAIFARASDLKAGAPILGRFPGGYTRVIDAMKASDASDPLIARFRFVRPGEDRGMAYDGLVHINGRWVFMPKPWRAISGE